MKIREGYGMTRDGRKVKIERNGDDVDIYPFSHDSGNGSFHGITATGRSCIHSDKDDIVSMIDDDASSPVRTVTRREIVPGEYGGVVIEEHVGSVVHLHMLRNTLDRNELLSAAMVFSQLAEALDDIGDAE